MFFGKFNLQGRADVGGGGEEGGGLRELDVRSSGPNIDSWTGGGKSQRNTPCCVVPI